MCLDLRFQLRRVGRSRRNLTGDRLDETAIHLEPLATLFQSLGRLIDLELHHRDGISLEEDIRDLVQLRANRAKEFAHYGFLVEGERDSPASTASARIRPR